MKIKLAPRARHGAVFCLIALSIGCNRSGRNQAPCQVQASQTDGHGHGTKRDAATPLRVRGGAMTFRSDNGWIKGDGTFCTVLDSSVKTIELDEVDKVPNPNPIQMPEEDWKLKVFARKVDGSIDTGSGMTIENRKPCGNSPTGILLTPITSGDKNESFYPIGGFDQLKEDGTSDISTSSSVRFRHISNSCLADEDACEHIGKIAINGANYTCLNGACEMTFSIK